MKIALCTSFGVRCGIATYSKALAEALANLGHEVYIVRLIRFGRRSQEYMRNLAYSFPEDADIIVISHEYGLFQELDGVFYPELRMRWRDKPIVTIMHSAGNFNLDPVIVGNSDAVVTHNEFCSRRLGFPNTIIAHGCKPAVCPPREQAKKSLGVNPQIPLVGYLGFISPYKGLEMLIEAVARIPECALLMAGGWHTGESTEYINRLKQTTLERLQGRCQWTGYVRDEELAKVYGALDILIYPSRFATESGALLMGLSHGCATLASSIPPFKEKEKKGALMTFKDVDDLRRKIRRLLRDESLSNELREGAKAWAYENCWEIIAKRHISLYEEVIKKKC